MSLSTHVLDTATGRPAPGVPVALHRRDGAGWTELAAGRTDADGRALLIEEQLAAADHRLVFDTGARGGFYPEVVVTFRPGPVAHLHVPLLLSPYGYSTYRGS